MALKTGTFAPGTIGDPTAKGNSCDDDEAGEGCIFSQNLLVEDATADEIAAAVAGTDTGAGVGVGVGNAGAGVAGTAVSTCELLRLSFFLRSRAEKEYAFFQPSSLLRLAPNAALLLSQ